MKKLSLILILFMVLSCEKEPMTNNTPPIDESIEASFFDTWSMYQTYNLTTQKTDTLENREKWLFTDTSVTKFFDWVHIIEKEKGEVINSTTYRIKYDGEDIDYTIQ